MSLAADNDFRTVLVLMKGSDADATIDAILGSGQDVDVKDEGPYWKLRGRGDIRVELDEVSAELGAPLSMAKWLVTMTSFVGNVETTPNQFIVHTQDGAGIQR
jgi:hypothetical protein